MKFKGKTVLITGGARGIGKAIAQSFAEEGAQVAINFRSDVRNAQATLKQLSGGPHLLLQADISIPDKIKKMVDHVVEKWGRLDILVNNAGIHNEHPVDEVSYEDWQREWETTLKVNLMGAANATYCAAQHMIRQGGGRIVCVSSRGAFRGEPDQPAYGASKAGLNAMSQSLAKKLAPHNVYVGIVAPGFVQTDMTAEILTGPRGDGIRRQSPFGRVAKPEEVARAVLFLASEGTEFMTGTIIDVNGASYLRT